MHEYECSIRSMIKCPGRLLVLVVDVVLEPLHRVLVAHLHDVHLLAGLGPNAQTRHARVAAAGTR